MELAYKKQNVFLYKFMPCLLFFIVSLMCLFGSYVYADNETIAFSDVNGNSLNVVLPNFTIDLSDYNYYVHVISNWEVGDENRYAYYIFASNSPIIYSGGSLVFSDTYYYYGLTYHVDDTDFSANTISSLNSHSPGSSPIGYIYTNFDILDSNGNVVFQAPPQQVEGTLGIIAEKTQGVEMNKTLQEITGILPVILVVIVGLIAIRKAIQFLMVRMKRA